jgi:surface protein
MKTMKKLIYLFLGLLIVACSSDDDNTAPVVTLIGESSITVTQNATYEDAGATATDNVDGDLTSNIVTTSNVDTSTLGTYTVTHSVSDASGNNGSASRQVDVGAPGVPTCDNNVFYIADNGKTLIACPNATAGNTGNWNGTTYTVVDEAMLRAMVPNEEDVTHVVTTLVTDMSELFWFITEQNPINQDIGSWDVSNVTDMYSMFYNCYEFNQDISHWDVSKVTNMNDMFSGAYAFNQDISSWDVSNVTDMGGMFNQCYPIINNTFGVFNQDLSSWDVGGVLECGAFLDCNPYWFKPPPSLNNCGLTFYIGQSYQGGIITYIDSTGQHGLIAATADQSSGIQWYNGSFGATGATGTAIGTGLTNTNAIIAAQGSGSYAASIARDYNGGGYTDWSLPSKDELNQLYVNRAAIGGFDYEYYWSSTEYDIQYAWLQDFGNGGQDVTDKASAANVRAVRTF